jgi:RNA polymerase sigma-70 factor, ECF subfamily
MSDAELVRQALAGRTEAYADLVRRWAGRITALCHARCGRAHLADDLAQETLLRGFRSLATLTDPDRFGPWLCGIALRTWLDWRKLRQNSQVPFSVLGTDRNPDDYLDPRSEREDPVERADELRQLVAEVEALPPDCRQVVMLYYYHDTTYREIAQLLGVSTATVNARLTRARALLRARLTDCRR